jgi:hypothetical protein
VIRRTNGKWGEPICWAFCLFFAALLSGGCAAWDRPTANDPPPEESEGMSALRPPGKKGQLLGIDERAREIERNLGVR